MCHQAARRELERQRQLEWERQRRDQLVAEKQREQNQVDELQANVGKLKLELEALVSDWGRQEVVQGAVLYELLDLLFIINFAP